MGRNASFSADDETASTLRNLGYSEEEIGATAGQLHPDLGTEERLRLSLRALSAEKSRQAQEKADVGAPPPNPKFEKTDPQPDTESAAYRRGRSDERWLRKNDPEYVGPSKETVKAVKARARVPKEPDPVQQALRTYRKAKSFSRAVRGGRRRW